MLTIVGMMLLGNIILTANRGINNIQQTMLNTGYEVAAISLARTTIEKAQELPFDKATMDSTWVNSLSQLTPPASLGQESATGDTLNDYDDYNGPKGRGGRIEYDTLLVAGKMYAIYKDSTQVHYVTRQSNGTIAITTASATWSKQLDVWVWKYDPGAPLATKKQDSLATVVHMFDIFSYWY